MKIKRFLAADMRTVLRMVREEQGADAVILSNRAVAGGIEVVAATDYDEQLAQDALKSLLPNKPSTALDQAADADIGLPTRLASALRSGVPAVSTPTEPAKRADFSTFLAEAKQRIAGVTPRSSSPLSPLASTVAERETEAVARRSSARAVRISPWEEDPSLVQVRAELVEMRGMMEREMQRMTGERLRGSPARALALDALVGYGCEETLAREVAARIPAEAEPARARGLMLGQLAHLLPVLTVDPLRTPGVVALVGPTGAGKTTTVAKLAARYAAEHGPRDVALVTTDTQRPGGPEQLRAYGRQFGLTVVEAGSEDALYVALDRLKSYPLVLIDTAGHGARDRAMVGQLNWLRHAGKVRTMLVMPANAHNADLDEVVRRFGFIVPEAAILTKLDETGRLGAALSVLVRHRLPMAYSTDGQRVPEDLAIADASRLVLKLEELRRASDRPVVSEDVDAA